MLSGLKNKNITQVIFSLIGAVIVSFIVYSPRLPLNLNISVKDTATQTIRSPQYIEFQTKDDIEKTNQLRNTRRRLIKPIYAIDTTVQKKITEKITSFFTAFKTLPSREFFDEQSFITYQQQQTLSSLSQSDLIQLESVVLENLSSILQSGIKEVNKASIRSKIAKFSSSSLTSEEIIVVQEIIEAYIEPNLKIDDDQTKKIINQQMSAIQPFVTSFKSGQVVIFEGEVFTDFHIDALKALKLYGSNTNTINYIGILIVTVLLFILFERFIYFFYRKLHSQTSTYLLAYTLLLLTLCISLGIYSLPEIKYIGTLQFLIPLPVMIILLCVLLTPNIAMISGTICSVLISIMHQNNIYILLFLFFATCTTTFSCYKVYKRSDLVIAGNIIGVINMAVIIAIGTMNDITDPIWFLYNSIIGFSNGFLCAMLSFAFLPYFESAFRITTSLGLLESSNLNHPLLKKLLLNAPGTYQHSLMVANLSEAAAEAIGADVILSRIGAYFHDIGKMKRPIFFSENQFGSTNPHDNLSPRMSKIIISAHAKDGVEMAQKYKLPIILQNIMMEHHGTSLVSFFYDVAKQDESEESDASLMEDFRYPGPKPQSKESGIIMLADTTEAAIRSIDKPTLTKIENLIEKVFVMKITDHQLNESGLSLNDIEQIKITFISIFKSIYHSRLDYAEELSKIVAQTKSKFHDT